MNARGVLLLAGGRGERFWPWSTPVRPKQLLPLARGGRTLLGATFERARRLAAAERILVLTSADLVEPVRRECPGATVVGEPVGRNTAAAIGAAAAWFQSHGGGAFAALPSDHQIDDMDAFTADFERAFAVAEREPVLVTFGIRPTHPDTNFGYIRRGAALAPHLHRVARFTEKPDRPTAERWLADGDHLWNSGMFVWRPGVLLDALEASRPGLAAPLRAMRFADADGFDAALRATFPALESVSIDYAVLEHAPNVVMIEAGFDWDDLGSWGAWARRQPRDARGNVVFGRAVAVDCDRCVVVGEMADGHVAAMGLKDMVVVGVDGGGTLACRVDETERVRQVTEAVRARGKE